MSRYRILKDTAPGKFTPTGETVDADPLSAPVKETAARSQEQAKIDGVLAERQAAEGACFAAEVVPDDNAKPR